MTRINGSNSSAHAVRQQADQAASNGTHDKKLGLGSFKPHVPGIPHKPSDLLKPNDPTPKPPGLSSLPKPPDSNTIKPPKPLRVPGLPRLPHGTVVGLQDRVSGAFNSLRDRLNPKPTLDPSQNTPSHQFHKTEK